jgi:DNA repair exonuclease SbcCD nuclease subunit
MIKRGKKFSPDLIISGDWHLRDTVPKCRTDDFWEAQWDKVGQIFYLSYEFSCPVYLAGDIFEHWRTSPFLINKTIKELLPYDGYIYSIIGNHDMPNHNINNMVKSGLQTLFDTKIVTRLLLQGDWGFDEETEIQPIKHNNRNIVFLHIMTYKGKSPWPGCTDPECNELFDWFPDADLIVTGHNHQSFTAKKGKQLLVNPGSLTRQTADQIDHKPCVFLYDSKQHKLKKHYLDIKDNVISREHINIVKSKENRINAFIEKLKHGWDAGLSFEENIERGIKENKIPKRIQQIIYNWMGV